MGIYQIDWNWFTGRDNGNTTVQVNIPPASVGAQVALYGQSGGGTNYTGIKHYRQRQQSGADQDIDFGDWPSWPPRLGGACPAYTAAD
jgi:hypothetical protein